MRYEDWDILLFPRDCKVPFKEFKVACHVVHDNGRFKRVFGVIVIDWKTESHRICAHAWIYRPSDCLLLCAQHGPRLPLQAFHPLVVDATC